MKERLLSYLTEHGMFNTVLIVFVIAMVVVVFGGIIISSFTGLDIFLSITLMLVLITLVFAISVLFSLGDIRFK